MRPISSAIIIVFCAFINFDDFILLFQETPTRHPGQGPSEITDRDLEEKVFYITN